MGEEEKSEYSPPYTHHIQHFSCSKCDLVQFFEVDSETVRYFEDLIKFKLHNEVFNPTKECKDCGHLHQYHDQSQCLGSNEIDGENIQNCKCHGFAFVKTQEPNQ